MKWQDLELFEYSPDAYYGKDKDGKEYGISHLSGNLKEVPKGTIEPHWNHATIDEVQNCIDRHKDDGRTEVKKSMELSDLIWWEHTPESFFGEDEDGNVYGISRKTGEIVPTPDVTIDLMWPGANITEVEQVIAKAKEYAKNKEAMSDKN